MSARTKAPYNPIGETGHKLGATYMCDYWREVYTVTALESDGDVSVRWHGGNGQQPRNGRHHTNVGKDKLITQGA